MPSITDTLICSLITVVGAILSSSLHKTSFYSSVSLKIGFLRADINVLPALAALAALIRMHAVMGLNVRELEQHRAH